MLEFKNVTKKYLRRAALDDVSFALEAGKVCLLLGPNGSGKTTAMKLIAGLSRETSGEVLFENRRIDAKCKAHIAYMPTENYFYNYMTVKDAGKYFEDFFLDFDPPPLRRVAAPHGAEPRGQGAPALQRHGGEAAPVADPEP